MVPFPGWLTLIHKKVEPHNKLTKGENLIQFLVDNLDVLPVQAARL